MTNSFTYRMPAGIPGAISRGAGQATVEPAGRQLGAPFPRYGMFGKTVAEKFVPLEAATPFGVITACWSGRSRPPPARTASAPPLRPTSGILDRLKRGYMTVTLAKGAAAKDAQVYVVTTAGGTVVRRRHRHLRLSGRRRHRRGCAGAFFTGPADANGIVEIAYNI
jgi:hypothetical protein